MAHRKYPRRDANPRLIVAGAAPSLRWRESPPISEIFVPKQCGIKGTSPLAFPPGDKMGQVMTNDLQGAGCASLRVENLADTAQRRMHPLTLLNPSLSRFLLFYHNYTDSAT